MGFRFSKRIKLFPGVSLNLSKSGASVSVGPRGANVTVNSKGVRKTISIPGTGMSSTEYTKFDSSPDQTSDASSDRKPISLLFWFILIGVVIAIVKMVS